MSEDKKSGEKTLKTLIALAGFAIGATSVVAWNNRKVIQEKALDVKDRALELKEKTIELTESAKLKLQELKERAESREQNSETTEELDNQTLNILPEAPLAFENSEDEDNKEK